MQILPKECSFSLRMQILPKGCRFSLRMQIAILLGYIVVVVQLLRPVQLSVTPWTAELQVSLYSCTSQSLLKFMSAGLAMPSNHLILCHPFLLLLLIFPSIKVFSSELAVHIRSSKYWSISFSIIPFNEYAGLDSFSIDWFDNLAVHRTLKILPSTTIQQHQFFTTQPYLWSKSLICTRLLEKSQFWLYGPFSAEWCFYFLIHCLGLS